MSTNDHYIAFLKSVSIRSKHNTRRLLMTSSSVAAFQSFLRTHIGDEVLVVSTNIGMEVFYLSEHDCSALIERAIADYMIEKDVVNENLRFKNNQDSIVVYQSFSYAIQVFANYPQVFLAYSKKFLHLLKENKTQIQLVATLSLFYHVALENLKASGNVPHLQRIEAMCNALEIKVPQGLNDFLQARLAKVLLHKIHSN